MRPADEAGGEFFNDDKDEAMNRNLVVALSGSLIRHATPAATSFLAGYGITVGGDTNPTLTIATAIGVYVAMQGVSFYRQWQKNRG